MNCTLVEFDYDRRRIYAIAQIKGQSELMYLDVALDAGGIKSFEKWESSMHGLVWGQE